MICKTNATIELRTICIWWLATLQMMPNTPGPTILISNELLADLLLVIFCEWLSVSLLRHTETPWNRIHWINGCWLCNCASMMFHVCEQTILALNPQDFCDLLFSKKEIAINPNVSVGFCLKCFAKICIYNRYTLKLDSMSRWDLNSVSLARICERDVCIKYT